MKQMIKWFYMLCMLVLLTPLSIAVAANYYDYNIVGSNSTISGGGSLGQYLKFSLFIDDTDSIRALVVRNPDEDQFEAGKMTLLFDSSVITPSNRIDQKTTNNQYEMMLDSGQQRLCDFNPEWIENKMKVYVRYESENDAESFAYAGPIIIKRTPLDDYGHLTVYLTPSEIADQAQWCLGDRCFSSGHKEELSPGIYHITFTTVPGWTAPCEARNIRIQRDEGVGTKESFSYYSNLCAAQVELVPDFARWRIWQTEKQEWSKWNKSMELIPGLDPGMTQIEFEAIDNWTFPGSNPKRNFNVTCERIDYDFANYCPHYPTAPAKVRATKHLHDKVLISWERDPDFLDCSFVYDVYRNTVNDPGSAKRIVQNVDGDMFSDHDVIYNQIYYYWIKAKSVSDFSGSFSAVAQGHKKIKPVFNFSVSDSTACQSLLTWSHDEDPDDVSFELWRHGQFEEGVKKARCIANNVTGNSYVDSDLFTGKTYYYWIVAKNDVSWSDIENDNSWTQGVARMIEPQDVVYTYCGLPPDNPWKKPWVEIRAPLMCGATDWVVNPVIKSRKGVKSLESLPDFCGTDVCENGNCLYVDCSAPYGQDQEYTVAYKNDFIDEGPSISIDCKACVPDPIITRVTKGELIETVRIEWSFDYNRTNIEFDIMKSDTNNPSADDWNYVDTTSLTFFEDSTPNSGYYCVKVKGVGHCPSVATNNEFGYPESCEFSLLPQSQTLPLGASTGSFILDSQENSKCRWEVRPDNTCPWIISVQPEFGTGRQTINYTISEVSDAQDGFIYILDKNDKDVEKFTIHRSAQISLQINGVGEGQVAVNGNNQNLPYHEVFTPPKEICLKAIPAVNWEFDKWLWNNNIVSDEEFCFNISEIITIDCYFKPEQVSLNISGSGSVRLNSTETVTLPYSGNQDKGKTIHLEFLTDCPVGTVWNVNGMDNIQSSLDVVMNADQNISVACLPVWEGSFSLIKSDGSNEQINLGIADKSSNTAASDNARIFFIEQDYLVDTYAEDIRQKTDSDEMVWYIGIDTANEDVSLTWTFTDDCQNQNASCQNYYYQIRSGKSSMGPVVVSSLDKISDALKINSSNEIKYFTFHRSKVRFPTIISAERGDSTPYVIIDFGTEPILKELPPSPPKEDCQLYIKLEGKKGIEINNAEGEEEYVVPLVVNPTGTSQESFPVSCTISWDPASFDNRFVYYYLTRIDNSQEYIVIEDMRTTKEFVVKGDDGSEDLLFNLYISKFEPDFTPPIQNKCPFFTKGEDISVENNAGKQTIQNWATEISPGGEDELDQNLEFIVEFDNAAIFAEDPQISPDGTLTFEPMTAEAGTSNLTVVLKDDGGLPTCDTSMDQHFSITVTQPCSTFVSLQIPDQFDTDPSSESIDLNKGDEFDVKITFQSDMLKEILAFGLSIHFDAQLIEVLEIQDGGIFGQNQTFVAENSIDASGSAGFAVASMQAVNVDSGVFCILKCKARSKSGKGCISLNSVDLSDSAATPIPHCTKNQCVEIAYPRLFTDLSISNVGTGTTFSSSHAITLMSGCVGAEMKILYDPTYLEAIIVEDGPFLAQNGELISVQKEILVDLDGNPTGEILWAAAYLGDTPPEGGGVLLDIDWQVSDDISTSEEIKTNITIDSASFADVNGNAIPVKIQKSTEVTIEPCRKTDLNCDNKVTIFDIVLAIACYNKTAACDCWLEIIPPKSIPCIKADLNGDGKVTIFDIVLLIQDYGWKKTTSRKLNTLNSTNQTPQITIPDVGIGESFYTILSAKNIVNMIGYEFILMFNPQVLECVSVESGNENMLENTERMSAPVEPIIENEEGKVVFAMASIAMGDVPGAYGNGQLASLQWRRKAAGPYNFFLSSIEVLKPNAVPSDMIIEGPFTVAEKVSTEIVNVDISRVDNHITASFENVVDDEDDVQFNVLISDNPKFESSELINEEPLDIQGRSNQFEFDLELDPNTTYYYRIQKVSKTGNVMFESPVYEEVIPPGKCEESIRGDLNNNCKLELSDLIQLLQILSGIDIEPVNQ